MSLNQTPSPDVAQAYQAVWPEVSRPAAGSTFPEWTTYRLVVVGGGRRPAQIVVVREAQRRAIRARDRRGTTYARARSTPTPTPYIERRITVRTTQRSRDVARVNATKGLSDYGRASTAPPPVAGRTIRPVVVMPRLSRIVARRRPRGLRSYERAPLWPLRPRPSLVVRRSRRPRRGRLVFLQAKVIPVYREKIKAIRRPHRSRRGHLVLLRSKAAPVAAVYRARIEIFRRRAIPRRRHVVFVRGVSVTTPTPLVRNRIISNVAARRRVLLTQMFRRHRPKVLRPAYPVAAAQPLRPRKPSWFARRRALEVRSHPRDRVFLRARLRVDRPRAPVEPQKRRPVRRARQRVLLRGRSPAFSGRLAPRYVSRRRSIAPWRRRREIALRSLKTSVSVARPRISVYRRRGRFARHSIFRYMHSRFVIVFGALPPYLEGDTDVVSDFDSERGTSTFESERGQSSFEGKTRVS